MCEIKEALSLALELIFEIFLNYITKYRKNMKMYTKATSCYPAHKWQRTVWLDDYIKYGKILAKGALQPHMYLHDN